MPNTSARSSTDNKYECYHDQRQGIEGSLFFGFWILDLPAETSSPHNRFVMNLRNAFVPLVVIELCTFVPTAFAVGERAAG
jgi:hypothetical protein